MADKTDIPVASFSLKVGTDDNYYAAVEQNADLNGNKSSHLPGTDMYISVFHSPNITPKSDRDFLVSASGIRISAQADKETLEEIKQDFTMVYPEDTEIKLNKPAWSIDLTGGDVIWYGEQLGEFVLSGKDKTTLTLKTAQNLAGMTNSRGKIATGTLTYRTKRKVYKVSLPPKVGSHEKYNIAIQIGFDEVR